MIRTATAGNLRTITLDRAERRNALTRDGLDALTAAVDGATEPVLYLTGAGDAFCAGADFEVIGDLDSESAADFARQGQRAARALETYDGAVVAGIDGPARGGGVELAVACDVRLGTQAASFAETGVSLGLFGSWGGTVRLPRVVGEGEALDIALSGRTIDAEEARRMGLVSRLVEDPRVVAERIADNDTRALRTVKERLRDTADRETQERREAEAFATLIDAFEPPNRNG